MTAHPFATGYLLGLVIAPLAVVFALMTGPTGGWAAFTALAIGAATLGPFTPSRLAGIAAGVGTLLAGGFAVLLVLLANADL
jgi:hypothetical protein